MSRVFEEVGPAALVVGDVVKGNGALWRILNFGRWAFRSDGGRCEFVTVECIDPLDTKFSVGFCKQFALYPESGKNQRHGIAGTVGTWEREGGRPVADGAVDLRKFAAGVYVDHPTHGEGRVMSVDMRGVVRVAFGRYDAEVAADSLSVVEKQGQ